jgi:hypothetical protein
MERPAFILGAGFSRALDASMPLLAELGVAVAEELSDHLTALDRTLAESNLEAWLTYLIDDQPFLSEYEQLRNRATLELAIAAIGAEVTGSCNSVLVEGGSWGHRPDWVDDLAAKWARSRSALVTLNYDTLVETALAPRLHEDVDERHLSISDIDPVYVPPIGAGMAVTYRLNPADHVQLFKLHGSIHWRWAGPSDRAGDTVCALPLLPENALPVPSKAAGETMFSEVQRRVPFIVPPSAGKATYFNNGFTRELWRSARQALAGADGLVCVGYSTPETDTSMRALLTDFAVTADRPVIVVNCDDSSEFQERFAQVMARETDADNLVWVLGDQCVEEFTQLYCS